MGGMSFKTLLPTGGLWMPTALGCGCAVAAGASSLLHGATTVSYTHLYILLDVGVGLGPLLLGLVQPVLGFRGLFEAMSLSLIHI